MKMERPGVTDKTPTIWRLDGHRRPVGSLPPSGQFNAVKTGRFTSREERKISNQTQNRDPVAYLPAEGAVFDPVVVRRAVEAEPFAGTDATLGPDPKAGAGHRGLPQLQVARDGNVIWNVDGRLVGRALLGCGEVLLVAAAVVAAGVQAVQVVAGVDVGVQQVVVVVAAAVQGGGGG